MRGEERRPIAAVTYPTQAARERAYLVAVERKSNDTPWSTQSSLEELAQLLGTAGAIAVGWAVQKLEHPHPAHYVGKGKLQEIAETRRHLNHDLVIFDDELSPTQQRNLEQALKVKVIDRTALILDIFAQHARTREGRLQVELAQHEYLLPRLRGQWQHLERLGGGIGTRGPGETQLETDRRLIRNKIRRLEVQLEQVHRHRSLYRRNRSRQGIPVVSLVGYTNAGKSTLMRALSGADVRIEERLFATLDPVTRRVRLPSGNHILLTDTVGFIQKLPHQLVAAFRATLEELAEADLLLHVVDITHPNAAEQCQTVETTLAELGLADKPRLTLLNKADRLTGDDGRPVTGLAEVHDPALPQTHQPPAATLLSAALGWGLADLLHLVEASLAGGSRFAQATRRQQPAASQITGD